MKKLLFLLILPLLLVSCENASDKYESISFFAMDTFCTIKAECEKDVLSVCEQKIRSIESTFSRTDENSEIYLLGKASSLSVSDETRDLLLKSLEIEENTSRAFSVKLGNLSLLWGFGSENPKVPPQKDIEECLALSRTDISLDGNTVKKDKDLIIDFGAIAKGYAANEVIKILKENGVENAMADLGGNIAVCGSSKNNLKDSSSGWNVGIRDPKNQNGIIGYINVTDKFISVSGNYERYFEKNGAKYHHILDYSTGYPAESGLSSVAVVCSDGALADALSTALFVMGEKKALSFYESGIYDFEMILVSSDGRIYVSENLELLN